MSESWYIPSDSLTFDTVCANQLRLKAQLEQIQTSEFHVDLSDVVHCDSAGLALLIDAKKRCQKMNKRLVIEGMSESIKALATFSGVIQILLV